MNLSFVRKLYRLVILLSLVLLTVLAFSMAKQRSFTRAHFSIGDSLYIELERCNLLIKEGAEDVGTIEAFGKNALQSSEHDSI